MPETPPPRFRKREQSAAQSFVFGADVRDLLRSLADGMGVSQVAVLELAVRRLARRPGPDDDTAPAERRTASPAGVPQSFRLTDVARQLLRQLSEEHPARFGDTQVEVMERAVRRFAQFAAREGFIEAAPRSRAR